MKRKIAYLTVAVFAIIIRLFLNYQSFLIPGINGGYYPLQVRLLLENGHLGFSDMPLYLLNRRILKNSIPWHYELAVIAFATLSFSPLMLTSDLQKNAFAIPLMLFFITFFLLFLKTKTRRSLALSVMFLIATGLTHFGVFAVSMSVFLIGLILFYRSRALIPVVLIPIVGALFVAAFDSTRAMRLLSLFSVIFKKPALLQAPLSPPDAINYLLSSLLIGVAVYYLIKRKHDLSDYIKNILILFLITIVILSFPLLDIEYSKRLGLLLFIPQSIVLLIMFNFITVRTRRILTACVAFVTLAAIVLMTGNAKPPAISMQAFVDLKKLENYIEKPSQTLIIARHGLEWWTAWQLRTKVAQDKAINADVFSKYPNVIILQQKRGVNPMGPGATPFHEPLLPPHKTLIFASDYFSAYIWPEQKQLNM